jgi:TrmH family RNA methyltransferase
MLSKAKVKYLNSLKSKKFRQKYNNFVAEGDKIAIEILKNAQNPNAAFSIEIEAIYGLSDWIKNHQDLLQPFQAIIAEVDNATLKKNLQPSNAKSSLNSFKTVRF